MQLWFTEKYTNHAQFSIAVKEQLYAGTSDFQQISVLDSMDFGRILVIDGYLMFTEKDEFIYHEMITHVPMAIHPMVRDVLIIGGGDGGAARELLRYDNIKRIDLVEIDGLVVTVCKQYLKKTACGFLDQRLQVYYEDGLKFVAGKKSQYDLIIVDSTDPIGPGEGLFTESFYQNCNEALKEDGIMVNQHESPFYPEDAAAMQKAHRRIVKTFPISQVYQAHIPTYASGHWLFGFASKKYHPIKDFKPDRWNSLKMNTDYYNTRLHEGAFALPNYVLKQLKAVENEDD